MGALGHVAPRFRLGTGQPRCGILRKAKFWNYPLRVDGRRPLPEVLCVEEVEACSGGAASELAGICSPAFAGSERTTHFTMQASVREGPPPVHLACRRKFDITSAAGVQKEAGRLRGANNRVGSECEVHPGVCVRRGSTTAGTAVPLYPAVHLRRRPAVHNQEA